MSDFEARLQGSFARQTMMTTLGANLVSVAEGHVVIAAPILPTVLQQHGYAHAAVAFALGDSAAGYAALSLLDEGQEVLTAETKINLLAPAQGDRLEAHGRVIRRGRRLVVVGAVVLAISEENATEVAILQGTMVPV